MNALYNPNVGVIEIVRAAGGLNPRVSHWPQLGDMIEFEVPGCGHTTATRWPQDVDTVEKVRKIIVERQEMYAAVEDDIVESNLFI